SFMRESGKPIDPGLLVLWSARDRSARECRLPRVSAAVVVGLFFCLLPARHAFAQVDTGTIAGRVLDPASAVVIGADVVVTEVDKNLSYQTKTGKSGSFT